MKDKVIGNFLLFFHRKEKFEKVFSHTRKKKKIIRIGPWYFKIIKKRKIYVYFSHIKLAKIAKIENTSFLGFNVSK